MPKFTLVSRKSNIQELYMMMLLRRRNTSIEAIRDTGNNKALEKMNTSNNKTIKVCATRVIKSCYRSQSFYC